MTGLRAAQHHVAGRPVRSLVAGAPRPSVPELVVVPGLGALGYLLPAVRACAVRTRVHLLDLPGFGRWRTAALPADLDSTAQALAAWLAGAGPPSPLLMGHSTGAQVALRAVTAGADAAALVLAGVTFPPSARTPAGLLRAVAATLPHERPGEVPAVLPDYVRGARRLPQLLRTCLVDRPENAVDRVRVARRVVRGEHDALCPPDWAQRLAPGQVVTVPGGHNAPFTHPGTFTDAVLSS